MKASEHTERMRAEITARIAPRTEILLPDGKHTRKVQIAMLTDSEVASLWRELFGVGE